MTSMFRKILVITSITHYQLFSILKEKKNKFSLYSLINSKSVIFNYTGRNKSNKQCQKACYEKCLPTVSIIQYNTLKDHDLL